MTARRIDIAYGTGSVPVHVPEGNLVKVLKVRPWPGLPDPTQAVERAIASPIGTPPLAEISKGKKNAVVVISDITRPVPNRLVLPPVLETLEAAGIPRERILVLIATGMHRPNEGEELVNLVGEEIAKNYRIENHHGTDLESHVDLGVSEEGVPLRVDRRFMEADLRIVTGLIEPHLMAGYSGGRKGVLPGVCSLETMKVMHGYRMIQHPLCTVGRLDDNPFHQIALKLARRVGVDFLVNVTINGDRELTGVYAGDLNDAHRAGVSELEEYVVDEVDEPVDIVVTGSGGYPLDQTLYQCLKGMIAAKEILKQGGTIVFCSHLGEGVGSPSFRQMLNDLTSPQEFLEGLMEEDYRQIDQWMVQDLCNVLLLTDGIYVYTENLADEDIRNALMEPVPSLDAGLEKALAKQGPGARVAVMPQGPYLIAEVAEAMGA
jgi:nickel-dependent lactate racemase